MLGSTREKELGSEARRRELNVFDEHLYSFPLVREIRRLAIARSRTPPVIPCAKHVHMRSIQDASAQGSSSVAPNGCWISSASGLELFTKKACGMSVAGPLKRSALLVNHSSRVIPRSHGPHILQSYRCRATLWCRNGYTHYRRCTAVPRNYYCVSFSSCHKLTNAAFFIYSEPCLWSTDTCVNGIVQIRTFPAHWCNCGRHP